MYFLCVLGKRYWGDFGLSKVSFVVIYQSSFVNNISIIYKMTVNDIHGLSHKGPKSFRNLQAKVYMDLE